MRKLLQAAELKASASVLGQKTKGEVTSNKGWRDSVQPGSQEKESTETPGISSTRERRGDVKEARRLLSMTKPRYQINSNMLAKFTK